MKKIKEIIMIDYNESKDPAIEIADSPENNTVDDGVSEITPLGEIVANAKDDQVLKMNFNEYLSLRESPGYSKNILVVLDNITKESDDIIYCENFDESLKDDEEEYPNDIEWCKVIVYTSSGYIYEGYLPKSHVSIK
jgi:hypothetical protein